MTEIISGEVHESSCPVSAWIRHGARGFQPICRCNARKIGKASPSAKIKFTVEEDVRAGETVEVNPATGMLRKFRGLGFSRMPEIQDDRVTALIEELMELRQQEHQLEMNLQFHNEQNDLCTTCGPALVRIQKRIAEIEGAAEKTAKQAHSPNSVANSVAWHKENRGE
jgi:hypothetical protein